MPAPAHIPPGLALALNLAAAGWHAFPLSATRKSPLANCPACQEVRGRPAHPIEACPCLPKGAWCHGVRAATVDPDRLTAWWRREPNAVPGIAAGPSGLVLIDIDAHGEPLPEDLATGLLPGIDLTAEPIPAATWDATAPFRDGRDSLALLARVRGLSNPWPQGPDHAPVVATTPSGGAHLWYQAPPDAQLRQAIAKNGNGLAWQVDIKAGWSYGLAPGAHPRSGRYRHVAGDITHPGRMPDWLATEVVRVASPPLPPTAPLRQPPTARRGDAGNRTAVYVDRVLDDRLPRVAGLSEGRPSALGAVAYYVAGLLAGAGLDDTDAEHRLIEAGLRAGLTHNIATRTVTRSMANGRTRPCPIPSDRAHNTGGSHAAR